MKIREEFKVREMAGEHVIVMPGRGGAADMTRIVSLNPSSMYLWEKLRGREFTAADAALLLTVYLFATAGTALASLTCKCVAMKARTEHACCCHCLHVADLPAAAGGEMRAPCCGNHHSTEIELYVSSSFDNNERYTRCIVLDLPPALAAECPCPAHVPFLREKVAERRTPFVREASACSVGFRAPPVLV